MKTLELRLVSSLSAKMIDDLRYLAIAGYPNEVCGIVYRHDIIIQYPNTFCGNKEHGFDMEIDLEDLCRLRHRV